MKIVYESSRGSKPVYGDTLMHYKYVRKEKKNGKWVYYYDIGEASYIDGYTGKKPSRIKGYTKLQDILGRDEQDRYNRAVSAVAQARPKPGPTTASKRAADDARFVKAGAEFTKAKKAYMKTPLGQLEKASNTIKKAKKAIGKWFKKIGTKLGA